MAALETFAQFVIPDDALHPVYRQGDVLYCAPARDIGPSLDGLEAVVTTSDGRRLLGILHLENDGQWALDGMDGRHERGLRLRRADRVAYIARARHRRPTLH